MIVDGVLPVAAREVHEHEEGQAEARVGDALGQRAAGRGSAGARAATCRGSGPGPRRRGRRSRRGTGRPRSSRRRSTESSTTAVAQTMSPRNIIPKPAGQQRERRSPQRAGELFMSSTPIAMSITQSQRDVHLGQHEARELLLVGRGRRADHEEPEEGAEAEHQDQRVEQQPSPGRAQRARAHATVNPANRTGKKAR